MVLTEFDEEKFLKMMRAEERAEGRAEGLAEGGRNLLIKVLLGSFILTYFSTKSLQRVNSISARSFDKLLYLDSNFSLFTLKISP